MKLRVQTQCKPKAESLLYAEVKPVFADAMLELFYPIPEK